MMKRLSISLAAIGLFANMTAAAQDSCDSYDCKMEKEYNTCKGSFVEIKKIYSCYTTALEEVCKDASDDDYRSCMSAWDVYTAKIYTDANWSKPPEKQSLEDKFVSLEKSGYSTETNSVHDFTIGCNAENIFIAFDTRYDMPAGSRVYGSFDRTGAREIDWNMTENPRLIMITGEEADDIFWEIGLEDTFAMVTETTEGQHITRFKSGNYDDVSSDLDQCTDF